jgi:isochorismate hydrolase
MTSTDIVPELTPQPGDLVVVKPMWDPFIGTSLDFDLRQLAMDDFDIDAHNHTVEKIFPRLGERATTDKALEQIM